MHSIEAQTCLSGSKAYPYLPFGFLVFLERASALAPSRWTNVSTSLQTAGIFGGTLTLFTLTIPKGKPKRVVAFPLNGEIPGSLYGASSKPQWT